MATLVILIVPGPQIEYAYVIIAMFFVYGMCSSVRCPIGFCMMCDFVPEKYHSTVGATWSIIDMIAYLYITLQFIDMGDNLIRPKIDLITRYNIFQFKITFY